jgi:hypothetical protein
MICKKEGMCRYEENVKDAIFLVGNVELVVSSLFISFVPRERLHFAACYMA